MKEKVSKTEEQWREALTPEQFDVCRLKGTERPFSGALYRNKEKGIYQCICCGNPLFHSETKYESGTGWPSFWDPILPDSVETRPDDSHGMRRIEVLCSVCDAHLGHLFDDGPAPTHRRYCINSVSLNFRKNE